MDLVPHMYWERQEPGSQLCAQHCLNNLLQQFTYSELDLADIARRLDEAERAQLQDPSRKSHNYDDTGYFSISVLERALEVWDLTLVRWRGEAMKAYQEKPEEQVAFILNLSSHWIPLRRFGASYNSPASLKRWYNLNSFLRAPEWISPTYLRMVLSQAEQEGYSVFCVRKARDPQAEEVEGWGDGGVASLPECQADMFAAQLGEPLDRSGGDIARIGRMNRATVGGSSREPLTTVNPDQPTVDPSSITPPTESADPFETSAAGPSSPISRSRRRQPDPVDPFAEGPVEQAPVPRGTRPPVPVWNVDEDEEIPSDEEHFPVDDAQEGMHGPSDFTRNQRDYDDEDAALQAALKASMEDIPSGWVAPSLETRALPKRPSQQSQTNVPPVLGQPVEAAPAEVAKPERKNTGKTETTDKSSGSKFKEEIDDDDEPAEELSPDEIRRRRLARFGA